MKAICHVCEQVFELSKVTFAKDSGVVQEKKEKGINAKASFTLIPSHPPIPGKAVTEVVSSTTGKVIELLCNGSLRLPKINVH